MTDENANPGPDGPLNSWDEETDPDGYSRNSLMSKDMFLDVVLELAHGLTEEHSSTIGLTVTSNGVVVSGLAISRAEWITRIVDQYKNSGADKMAAEIEKIFNQAHGIMVEKTTSRNAARLPLRPRPFLHMKNVRIGSGENCVQLPLWRGAITDITGWSLGSWNPKQEPGGEQ